MGPAAVAFMGAGLFLQAGEKYKAGIAQANAEQQNADFYRQQADYAQAAGDRQRLLHDRDTKITYGEQASAFAKAGVDTSQSSTYMAKEMYFGQQEDFAIKSETDMNVTLASLRAKSAAAQAFEQEGAANSGVLANLFVGGAGMMNYQNNKGSD